MMYIGGTSQFRCITAVTLASLFAVLAGCRVDGQLRVSDDIARRLPDEARNGGLALSDMAGFDSLLEGNDESGDAAEEATFRVYLTPPRDVEDALTAKIAKGNAADEDLQPEDSRFQRARTVDLDVPGGGDALDFVGFDGGLEIRHDGTVGSFVSPKLLVFVAEDTVDNIYEEADGSEGAPSVQVSSVEVDRSLGPGDPVLISLSEMVERGDEAFRILEQGRFQIAVVFGAGVRAENTDSEISWPERVSWRITDITLTLGVTPYAAFR